MTFLIQVINNKVKQLLQDSFLLSLGFLLRLCSPQIYCLWFSPTILISVVVDRSTTK